MEDRSEFVIAALASALSDAIAGMIIGALAITLFAC